MYNLEREWSTKRDFWANNAIITLSGTIWFFRKHHPEFCTIPHITEFLLNDFQTILEILSTDDELSRIMAPVISPLKRGATSQLAGAESSTQFPLSKLKNPEIYYVLNPQIGEELDLDITNPDNPVILCLCNTPNLRNAISPAIGAIMQICKMQMNRLGKNKSIFMVDELPTIYIDKLDQLPAEARKKGVCTILGAQTYAQLERDYGKENSKVVVDNMGNKFYGMSNLDSAERLSKTMGDIKTQNLSQTHSDSGTSFTESNKDEKLIKSSDVMTQSAGHFTGIIANGDPPLFSAQLNQFRYPTLEIPHFNFPVDMDDEDLQNKILDKIIEENYLQVVSDIDNLILTYNISSE